MDEKTREAPEGRKKASPYAGSHWSAQYQSLPSQGRWLGAAGTERSCRKETTSQSPSVTAPLKGEPRPYKVQRKERRPTRKKVQPNRSRLHLLFIAIVLRQLAANLIPTVSGGAYQDARKVSIEWNARLKHRRSPEFRCRMHQTVTQRPFSPPSFPARRKRRGRRRRVRNDHDGTSRRKRRLLSSVLVSSFPNRKLNLRFGSFPADLRQPLSLGFAEPAPLPGEPWDGVSLPERRWCG